MAGETQEEVWSIRDGDPLSATGRIERTCIIRRDDVEAKTVSTCALSCTAEDWMIEARVEAFENGEPIFDKTFAQTIPRDMM